MNPSSWHLWLELLIGIGVLATSLAGLVRWVVRPQITRAVEAAMGDVKRTIDKDIRGIHHRIDELGARETVCRAEVLSEVARAERIAAEKVALLSSVVVEIKRDTRMLVTHLLGQKKDVQP